VGVFPEVVVFLLAALVAVVDITVAYHRPLVGGTTSPGYLSGISTRKVADITDALSKVRVGKDAVSRIASRLEEQQKEWRERSFEEKAYPYLYLDAMYLKVRWGARVSSMALLVCVGVDEEGFREVLAVEVADSEKGVAYASLLQGSSTEAYAECA
jgi:transposase-like protein